MNKLEKGSRVIALSPYSGEREIGTIVDFDTHHRKGDLAVVYFDDFGQILECFIDEVELLDQSDLKSGY